MVVLGENSNDMLAIKAQFNNNSNQLELGS